MRAYAKKPLHQQSSKNEQLSFPPISTSGIYKVINISVMSNGYN